MTATGPLKAQTHGPTSQHLKLNGILVLVSNNNNFLDHYVSSPE